MFLRQMRYKGDHQMKKQTLKKGLAAVLGLSLFLQMPSVHSMIQISAYAQERSATINASSLNVRSGAGTSYSSVAKLTKGTAVTVVGEKNASDGKTWYQIRFTSGGTTQTGYVLSTYVKFPVTYSHDSGFESQLSAQGFPESYKEGLRQIHARYPNWTFTAVKTGLDWNTVIQNEGVLGRNLVHTNSISSYKSLADGAYNWDSGTWTGFDGSTWVAASTEIISYYMDPRNFLDEVNVFQFLDQSYNSTLHTKEGLQSMLKGTFMEGSVKTTISASGSTSSSGSNSGSSTGSTTTSGSSNVVTAGPGVSSGTSSSSATTNAGNSGITSATPGGSTGSSSSGTSQTPSSGQSQTVRLEGPSASISKNKAELVASSVVIGVGPGASSSGNSTTNSGASTENSPNSSSSGTISSGSQTSTSASSGVTYADAIMSAAQSSGVSPYVIAAMIIQEQGRNGTGNSISGNYAGYTGYYNYFNVGAYASDGMSAVQRGLWYASQSGSYARPWTTPESSIAGGAQFYGTNYVKAGQDTLYLKKYNVQGSNIYKHQYMTNVDGAASEGSIFAEGFTAEQKNTALNFKIPVYNNMPDTPCAQPTLSGSPNNKLNGLGVEGFTLTPTFNRDTYSYDLIVDQSVSNVTVSASTIDSKASIRGNGTVSLSNGTNDISVVVRAENGTERTYTIHVVRQSGGPTYNAGAGGSTPGTGSSTVTVNNPSSGTASSGTTTSGVITAGPGGNSGGQAAASSPTSTTAASSNTVTFSSPGGN